MRGRRIHDFQSCSLDRSDTSPQTLSAATQSPPWRTVQLGIPASCSPAKLIHRINFAPAHPLGHLSANSFCRYSEPSLADCPARYHQLCRKRRGRLPHAPWARNRRRRDSGGSGRHRCIFFDGGFCGRQCFRRRWIHAAALRRNGTRLGLNHCRRLE